LNTKIICTICLKEQKHLGNFCQNYSGNSSVDVTGLLNLTTFNIFTNFKGEILSSEKKFMEEGNAKAESCPPRLLEALDSIDDHQDVYVQDKDVPLCNENVQGICSSVSSLVVSQFLKVCFNVTT